MLCEIGSDLADRQIGVPIAVSCSRPEMHFKISETEVLGPKSIKVVF
jgi:hypothetical protein